MSRMAGLAVDALGDLHPTGQHGLGRPEHHCHVATVLQRALLDDRELGQLLR